MQSDYNAMHNVNKTDRGKMSVSFNIKIIAVNYHAKRYIVKMRNASKQKKKQVLVHGNKITIKNNIQA